MVSFFAKEQKISKEDLNEIITRFDVKTNNYVYAIPSSAQCVALNLFYALYITGYVRGYLLSFEVFYPDSVACIAIYPAFY